MHGARRLTRWLVRENHVFGSSFARITFQNRSNTVNDLSTYFTEPMILQCHRQAAPHDLVFGALPGGIKALRKTQLGLGTKETGSRYYRDTWVVASNACCFAFGETDSSATLHTTAHAARWTIALRESLSDWCDNLPGRRPTSTSGCCLANELQAPSSHVRNPLQDEKFAPLLRIMVTTTVVPPTGQRTLLEGKTLHGGVHQPTLLFGIPSFFDVCCTHYPLHTSVLGICV